MTGGNRLPLGKFLDDLPKALYVVAHIAFLAVGVWLYARAQGAGGVPAGPLLLYAASQIVFFGYFASWITLKMAVLAEQTLMVAMVVMLVFLAA
jgi:hypothetical protein